MDLHTVIIQAGGLGSRMLHLTLNKPKCLVSWGNKTLLERTIDTFKNINPYTHFVIIGGYKYKVLKDYCKFKLKNTNYKVISGDLNGSGSGIEKALNYVPNNVPFAVTWCDLVFKRDFTLPDTIDTCCYCSLEHKFRKPMWVNGKVAKVIGFYTFANKGVLNGYKDCYSFTDYVQSRVCPKAVLTDKVNEVGSFIDWVKAKEESIPHRVHNNIVINGDRVIKEGVGKAGIEKVRREYDWYCSVGTTVATPKILESKDNGYVMGYIKGIPLNQLFPKISVGKRIKLLQKVKESMNRIHTYLDETYEDFSIPDEYLDYVERRIKKYTDVIPFMRSNLVPINGTYYNNPIKHLPQIISKLETFTCSPIHGDLTLSNIYYDEESDTVIFTDPKPNGYPGDNGKFCGHQLYDIAKLTYSVKYGYDSFNRYKNSLKIDEAGITIDSVEENSLYDEVLDISPETKILVGFMWLGVIECVDYDYDLMCYAFCKAVTILGEFVEG